MGENKAKTLSRDVETVRTLIEESSSGVLCMVNGLNFLKGKTVCPLVGQTEDPFRWKIQ